MGEPGYALTELSKLRARGRTDLRVAPALPLGRRFADAYPESLPPPLTSFIGRELELAEIQAVIAEARMVTLVGPGGCGKTRLAAEVGAQCADSYPRGVWWVDLGPVSDPQFVVRAALNALGLLDTRGLEPVERLTRYLDRQAALVIFDNCEHVLAAAAELADQMLRACPALTVMATSREPLGVSGEREWRVPPLSLPEKGDSAAKVLASEAVRLFTERAVAVQRTFRLENDDTATVAEICSRLDGMPLAIELAAARVRSLSPRHILRGLANRFRLLDNGSRTAPDRHQTLQASVEWSHDLLSEAERTLFRRLAAFSGSFTLEAAEQVCAGERLESCEILTVLSDLVDKSLVIFDGRRYRLLQTIHDYAGGRLLEAGEEDAVRRRHAAWSVARAEAAARELEVAPRGETLVALEDDHDDFRAALRWTLEHGDGESSLRLVIALGVFWAIRGHFTEGLAWYRRVLSIVRGDRSPNRVKALGHLAILSAMGMELSGGYGMAEAAEASALADELADASLGVRARFVEGVLLGFKAPDEGCSALEDLAEVARRTGDAWALKEALYWRSFHLVFHCDLPERAQAVLDDLRSVADLSGSQYWRAWHGVCGGIAAVRAGRLLEARRLLQDSLNQAYEVADPMLEMYSVGFLWEVAAADGDYPEARALLSRSIERQDRAGTLLRLEWLELCLAHAAVLEGDLATAELQLKKAGANVRAGGLPAQIASLAVATASVALQRGDLVAARASVDEALTVTHQLPNPWFQRAAHNCAGRLARAEGRAPEAENEFRQALALCVKHDFRGVAAEPLEALASLAAAGERSAEAARLFGAAQSLRESTGHVRWKVDRPAYDADVARLRNIMSDEALDRAWKEGAELSLEDAAADVFRARGRALTPTALGVVAVPAETPPPQGNVVRRDGAYWTIVWEGKAFLLKHTKGLHWLAALLAHPGREFHALDLAATDDELRALTIEADAAIRPDLGDAGAILDAEAKAQYRRRLDDLRDELEEAERFHDTGRATKSREEIELLTEELARATGLGGRDRKAASAAERARANVTMAIRAALKRIAEQSPSLGHHLAATVRTGKFCSYTPDPRITICWRVGLQP